MVRGDDVYTAYCVPKTRIRSPNITIVAPRGFANLVKSIAPPFGLNVNSCTSAASYERTQVNE